MYNVNSDFFCGPKNYCTVFCKQIFVRLWLGAVYHTAQSKKLQIPKSHNCATHKKNICCVSSLMSTSCQSNKTQETRKNCHANIKAEIK